MVQCIKRSGGTRRLPSVDCNIDLYYLHRINPDIPVEEVAQAMGRLIDEGMIRGWGMSMVNVAYLQRVQDIAPLTAVQNIYSMMDRAYEKGVIPMNTAQNDFKD